MLERRLVKELLERGLKEEATHLIIFFDKYDGISVSRYVRRGQSVQEVIDSNLKFSDSLCIEGIYNYDLDFNEQLKERCPNHREPSKKYKTLYEKALDYATEKHKGKTRKGTVPIDYIEHPIAVSKLIEKYMDNDSDIRIYKAAALLHDTLEDSDATYEEECSLFGKQVANIVLSVTSDKKKQKEQGKDVYLSNKMVEMNDNSLILKLCDRLDNVAGLDTVSDEFNEKYVRETIYIINYLLLYRDLNDIQLRIIKDIMAKVKEVSVVSPVLIKPKINKYENK